MIRYTVPHPFFKQSGLVKTILHYTGLLRTILDKTSQVYCHDHTRLQQNKTPRLDIVMICVYEHKGICIPMICPLISMTTLLPTLYNIAKVVKLIVSTSTPTSKGPQNVTNDQG